MFFVTKRERARVTCKARTQSLRGLRLVIRIWSKSDQIYGRIFNEGQLKLIEEGQFYGFISLQIRTKFKWSERDSFEIKFNFGWLRWESNALNFERAIENDEPQPLFNDWLRLFFWSSQWLRERFAKNFQLKTFKLKMTFQINSFQQAPPLYGQTSNWRLRRWT